MQPGCRVTYPILADPNRDFIKQLNMVDPDEKDNSGKQLPSRALHIVGPDKKVSTFVVVGSQCYISWSELLVTPQNYILEGRADKTKLSVPGEYWPKH